MSEFPKWAYGPDGAAEVFDRADQVPAGWQDHPSKVITPAKTGSKPLAPVVDQVPGSQTGTKPVVAENNATATETGGAAKERQVGDVSNTLDTDGWAWDADLHSATQSKTGAGLWRMKVGVKRPAAKEGFPKPVLDL